MAPQTRPKAIVGFQLAEDQKNYSQLISCYGSEVTTVGSFEELQTAIGSNGARVDYATYLFEAYLGRQGAADFSPGIYVKNALEDRIGSVEFIPVADTPEMVEKAQEAGLPCMLKQEALEYFTFKIHKRSQELRKTG
ncbi:hypothetical protein CMO92_04185 [Candidatus Woesearchaeota archaeon]|nr:hypothetical protein [Candidatus Woesearchaeota archaeon]